MKNCIILICLILFYSSCKEEEEKINRQDVVSRHQVLIKEVDTLNSLSLGNGRFAMTMDITGLQTFPLTYKNGVPLGTMSEWGWHSFLPDREYKIEETLKTLKSHEREVPYAIQWASDTEAGKAANYIRQNPYRIHLGTVGWHILKSDGTKATIHDIKKVDQKLDLWKGELISNFEVEGIPVQVISLMSQDNDILGVRVKSKLIELERLSLQALYPYPTNEFLDEAVKYDSLESDRLKYKFIDKGKLSITRKLDSTEYITGINSSIHIDSVLPVDNGYVIKPDILSDTWDFSVEFSKEENSDNEVQFETLRKQVNTDFISFWNSGGIIDFGQVTDPRAKEIERRMILSLYLTRINCGGKSPPQETGLTYNSWYGKPHMEMTWWHGVHFSLWGRPEVLENQMDWYLRNWKNAEIMAKRQGFDGVRWQKMTDNEGGETVSSIGSYLIWQQPHIIYFSELLYQHSKDEKLLEKYAGLVDKTAKFMADFAHKYPDSDKYVLGPGVIPAQERFDPEKTYNPTFELAYWRWGLETAQKWRERLGKERNKKWDTVLNNLSPLTIKNNLYLATENTPDSYEEKRYMTDHPSVLGAYGMLPSTKGLDKQVMKNTFNKIWDDWHWEETWGWDFPMTAMTATRLGYADKAVDALLMPVTTNTYLKNGHNYQNKTLRLYLPGNGGFLTALAMMTTGTLETNDEISGFPESWEVKHEGIHKIP